MGGIHCETDRCCKAANRKQCHKLEFICLGAYVWGKSNAFRKLGAPLKLAAHEISFMHSRSVEVLDGLNRCI